MLQDWETGMIGNNPGTVARLPRLATTARVAINRVRGRLRPGPVRPGPLNAELHSAA